jgi:hypothetical protein
MQYPSDGEVALILGPPSDDGRHPQQAGVQRRFEAIYQRQNAGQNQSSVWNDTYATPGNSTSAVWKGEGSSDSDSARRKGFDDGFQTAKVFAIYGPSKLGFTEQYINEALWMAMSRGAVSSGMEQDYRTGFTLGLKYGEWKMVEAIRSM